MRWRGRGLAAVALLAAAGCTDPERATEADAAGRRAPEVASPVAVTVDERGAVWALDDRGRHLVLRTGDGDGGDVAVDLDPGAAARPRGVQLHPHDGGVVLARVVCDDEHCDHAVLDVTHHTVDGGVIASRRWGGDPPAVASPSAVILAGGGDDTVAVRSNRVVVTADGSVTLPSPLGDPCVVDGVLHAVAFDEATATDSATTLPGPDAVLSGHLERDDGDGWTAVPGSAFSYEQGDRYELRCSGSGLELTRLGEVASRVWDGATWRELDPPAHEWVYGPVLDHLGLVGVDGDGAVVRVDPTTGDVLAAVTPDPKHAARWTGGPPPSGPFALGTGERPVAVACTTAPDHGEARCTTFGGR